MSSSFFYQNFYDNLGPNIKFGLPYNNFKLSKFTIVSDIRDSTLQSKYTQEYVNESSSPVEAIYELPLPLTSTITDLLVVYKGESFTGKIKEKKKAEQKYDDSIASGGQGFMISREDNGVFKLSLGNIEPKTPITIIFNIIGEIHSHLDTIHYFIPRSSFPNTRFYFLVQLNIYLTVGIESIKSNDNRTFKEVIMKFDNKATVTIENEQFSGLKNTDLQVIIQPKTSNKMEINLEENEKDQTLAMGISYYPEFSNIDELDIDQKSEYIFVLDCSGSMSGSSIESAKSTLNLLMKSIPENSKFNIYRFGTHFKKLYNESQLYNNATLNEAVVQISQTKADLGGTELLAPIKDIFNSPYDPEYPRQVFILTDGEVDEKQSLINFVRQESHVRIFTFGIGSGVDVGLVTGISGASRGQYELITDMKNMESQVIKLLKKSMEPMISNIRLQWPEGISVQQAPTIIRPIYNQERMSLYALVNLKNSPNLPQEFQLQITANGPKGDILQFPITINRSTGNKQSQNTHKLAGLMMINDFLDQEKRLQSPLYQEQIVQLSKQYNILSKYTSLLITKESNSVTTETMEHVLVNPPEIQVDEDIYNDNYDTHSYSDDIWSSEEEHDEDMDDLDNDLEGEMEEQTKYASTSNYQVSQILNENSMKRKSSLQNSRPYQEQYGGGPMSQGAVSTPVAFNSPMKPLSSKAISGPLMSIIDSQNANGSWSEDKSPIKPKKPSPAELTANKDIWTTLIILATLIKQYSNEKDLWSLIAQKATKFVRQQLSKLSLLDFYDKYLQDATNSL
ncbi:type A von Willebrand factor domain-containing protein [Tieghemostelium lacteum]|uniref:Type A von Willebrand factor domain-containing protein n=1 Tax=Tieghemostelium lacteum TaxID=361077 RepID=A0A151ZEA5_TIELA|nr:type A von Willebrand factor domain-containing protein [Tieghemostelium lacteum]|eukprot:KYQ92281.1 type A von Willebrand factor domain-containing protein [Tieghemostelium lacteum]